MSEGYGTYCKAALPGGYRHALQAGRDTLPRNVTFNGLTSTVNNPDRVPIGRHQPWHGFGYRAAGLRLRLSDAAGWAARHRPGHEPLAAQHPCSPGAPALN